MNTHYGTTSLLEIIITVIVVTGLLFSIREALFAYGDWRASAAGDYRNGRYRIASRLLRSDVSRVAFWVAFLLGSWVALLSPEPEPSFGFVARLKTARDLVWILSACVFWVGAILDRRERKEALKGRG